MSKHSDENNIRLSIVEKIIKGLIFLGQFGQFLLCFYSLNRNFGSLVITIPLTLWFYINSIKDSSLKKFDRYLAALVLLSFVSHSFLYALFEFLLKIEFSFQRQGGDRIWNHPIPMWLHIIWLGSLISYFCISAVRTTL